MRPKKSLLFSIILAISLFLGGCFRTLQPDPGIEGVPAFIPPTKVILTNTPIPTETPSLLETPVSSNPCQDSLTFIKDETIPDGSKIEPGASLDKRWVVQNSGTCNWGEGYTIQLIGGSDMGVESSLDIYPARSNTTTTIRIQFFAPKDPGNYRSAWQAFNPDGIAFGDPFYIDIVVTE